MKSVFPFLIFISILPGLAISNPSNVFIIKGTIHGLATGTVRLDYLNPNGDDTTITATVVAEKFTLTGVVPEPELAHLNISGTWSYGLKFFLENATININLVKDEPEKTAISGSYSNIIYQQLEPRQRDFFENARHYDAVQNQAKSTRNTTLQKSNDSIWASQQQQWVQAIRTSIAANNKNYAALYFVRWLLFHPGNYDVIMSLFNSLDEVVRKGPAGKEFLSIFGAAHKTSIGQPAPEIAGSDTSGHPVTLASLKGKVVLLDFWASYCAICRRENPHLKTVYDKYHAAGFEIVSLSLDNARPEWVRAIQADNLNWPQLSELRGGAGASAGVYDVSDLPRNFLIDKAGKIIGKDLYGDDLIGKLQQALTGSGK